MFLYVLPNGNTCCICISMGMHMEKHNCQSCLCGNPYLCISTQIYGLPYAFAWKFIWKSINSDGNTYLWISILRYALPYAIPCKTMSKYGLPYEF